MDLSDKGEKSPYVICKGNKWGSSCYCTVYCNTRSIHALCQNFQQKHLFQTLHAVTKIRRKNVLCGLFELERILITS